MDTINDICLDALLDRSQGKTFEELTEADQAELTRAQSDKPSSVRELYCQVEDCKTTKKAVLMGGRILVLTGSFHPEHYPCKNGK